MKHLDIQLFDTQFVIIRNREKLLVDMAACDFVPNLETLIKHKSNINWQGMRKLFVQTSAEPYDEYWDTVTVECKQYADAIKHLFTGTGYTEQMKVATIKAALDTYETNLATAFYNIWSRL